jgi:polyferredoxin
LVNECPVTTRTVVAERPGQDDAKRETTRVKGNKMSTILLIVLVLLLVGALPAWPYSSSWGYYPSGGLGLVLLVVLLLVLLGRI